MSYFEHTKRDLAEAKRELGEALLALLNDTTQKMNDEDFERDRQYLLEDLVTRVALIAENAGADVGLFPDVQDSMRVRCAYDLLDAVPDGETTQDITPALYSSTHVKTTSKPGHLPRIGITKVEEDGIRWDG